MDTVRCPAVSAILSLGLVLAIGCDNRTQTCVVLGYKEFGPQVLAWEHIGMQWWQWDNHGDSNPKTSYGIRIVVYRNISLKEVKKTYPVIPEKNQDYRYFEFNEALGYLDRNINENIEPELTKQLLETKEIILTALKNKGVRCGNESR